MLGFGVFLKDLIQEDLERFLFHLKKQWISNYFHCVSEREGKGSTWRWLGSFVWVVKQIQLGTEREKSTAKIERYVWIYPRDGENPPKRKVFTPWIMKWENMSHSPWTKKFQAFVSLVVPSWWSSVETRSVSMTLKLECSWNTSVLKQPFQHYFLRSFILYHPRTCSVLTHHSLKTGMELD